MLIRFIIFSDCALIIPHRNNLAFKMIGISLNKNEMHGDECICALRTGLRAGVSHRCAVCDPEWPVLLNSSRGSQTAGRSLVR